MNYENEVLEEVVFLMPLSQEEDFIPRDCEWGWSTMWGEG